jgi:hypothetical protein
MLTSVFLAFEAYTRSLKRRPVLERWKDGKMGEITRKEGLDRKREGNAAAAKQAAFEARRKKTRSYVVGWDPLRGVQGGAAAPMSILKPGKDAQLSAKPCDRLSPDIQGRQSNVQESVGQNNPKAGL